jgi:two-component system, chemotaxis family, CheB/CheR fusion protein
VKKNTTEKKGRTKSTAINKKGMAASTGKDLYIVGIGASAGGLEALKKFFDHISPVQGLSFVIVQHLSPNHKSLLTELLSGHTQMKVAEVADGDKVRANYVYVIPPNRELRIENGILHLKKPEEGKGRRPIDLFFTSLAEDQKDKAIGIILSGTGTEGTLGLREIKAEGGLTIVQEPTSAQFDGMPQSAIAAKTADYIVIPEKMPATLVRYIDLRRVQPTEFDVPLMNLDLQLKKIFQVIRVQTGYDFSNYKTNTIVRRITKRIAYNQLDSIDHYIEFLVRNPAEVESLYKDFLIGVTSFFRDKEVFKSIEANAIPHLLQHKEQGMQIRVWVCGCSTGEEAYSLAILFREALQKTNSFVKVLIFASDIDKDAIKVARTGTYPETIATDLTAERLAENFIKHEKGYRLKKEIREMVVFAYHNVIKDPPFSKMDLITCRNLLIYMNSDLQKKLIPLFHYSLNKDGLLILGTSESIGDNAGMFADFDGKNKLFSKKQDVVSPKPPTNFEPIHHKLEEHMQQPDNLSESPKKSNMSGVIERYLRDHYSPPAVIIDKNNEVLWFSGNTGLYLEPAEGEARLDVLAMAKKGLRPALEKAIKKARSQAREVQEKEVDVMVNNYFKTINLFVKKVNTESESRGALMIVFEPFDKIVPVSEKGHPPDKGANRLKVHNLEKELKVTHEQLQSAVNDLDILKENLRTTNEDFQSSNEELQSSNEELETSREELQSLNEELITVNNELQEKIAQLSQSNDDLNNLLRSIDVATIFLDRALKIKRFTPTATKIFNLIPSDIDRPVSHLTNNILYKDMEADVKAALKKLEVKTSVVQSKEGAWYQVKIIPYRSGENIIEGVLITFVEITEQKKVAENYKKTNEHLNLIMENLPAIPYTCVATPEIAFSFVGNSAQKVLGFAPDQFIVNKDFWIKRVHPLDKKKMLSAFARVEATGRIEHNFRWKCANGRYKYFINLIRYAFAENGEKSYIVGVWQEIPEEKEVKLITRS